MTGNEGIKVYKSEKMIKLIKDGYECEVMEMIDGHYIIDSILLEFQEGRSPGVLYAVFCYDQFIPSNNQKTEIYLKNGECHREDGPALIFPDGLSYWYCDGNLHREGGPAVEDKIKINGQPIEEEYWIEGIRYEFDDYIQLNRSLRIDKILDGPRINRNKRIDRILDKNKKKK